MNIKGLIIGGHAQLGSLGVFGIYGGSTGTASGGVTPPIPPPVSESMDYYRMGFLIWVLGDKSDTFDYYRTGFVFSGVG